MHEHQFCARNQMAGAVGFRGWHWLLCCLCCGPILTNICFLSFMVNHRLDVALLTSTFVNMFSLFLLPALFLSHLPDIPSQARVTRACHARCSRCTTRRH
ncbi:hypothetical protein B0H17DRAFT_138609 [Mycena rosella]|uniref:Uncharacterized protein n=1 Tax=Mycena rosella TaxID=1033263 RepID=A0AAD7E0T4_MYCRO|nr:hypothetical protein B0H17DRAFT_138609 [Mycena rosella]